MARTLPVAPRLVLRAWSAARCSRADGRTCQSTRASAGTRVISPVWPAAGPSRVAVCSDRGEFAKPKSGIGPPYCGAWNGLRSLAILPSQTTISPEAIVVVVTTELCGAGRTQSYTPSDARAARALCCDDVRVERAPLVRGVHDGPWSTLGVHVAHFCPMCLTARNSLRNPKSPVMSRTCPRGSTRNPRGAGGPSGPCGSTRTCSAASWHGWLSTHLPKKGRVHEFRKLQVVGFSLYMVIFLHKGL